jgi:hypothetical protein
MLLSKRHIDDHAEPIFRFVALKGSQVNNPATGAAQIAT